MAFIQAHAFEYWNTEYWNITCKISAVSSGLNGQTSSISSNFEMIHAPKSFNILWTKIY